MDASRQSKDSCWQPGRTHKTGRNQLGFKAWSSITSDTLKRSFLVCGISNALDGTQDDMVSDDLPDIDASEVEIAQPDALEEEEDIDDVDPFSDDSDKAVKYGEYCYSFVIDSSYVERVNACLRGCLHNCLDII